MDRKFFATACLMAALAIALGAFGAHALKASLSASMLVVFETGVRYQMYHSFALLMVALAFAHWPGKGLLAAGWMFIVGTVLFSGSLYAISLGAPQMPGLVTPIGGVLLIAGWMTLAWSVWKSTSGR